MLLRALPLCALAALPVLVSAVDDSPLASAPTEFARAQAASDMQWQPWDEAALAQAQQQGKPVYVFIGSTLSGLSHETINQTFQSAKTVDWLNENFFCVFVDADAQPAVAAYGQHFINSVKQLRSSPVHLWLTPDTLQPYDGANYLPPSEEWGKPGFLKAARTALENWTVDRARARALATEGLGMMRQPAVDVAAKIDVGSRLNIAAQAWVATIDPVNGGFGSVPKLPEPELIRFLLARGGAAREVALKAARAVVSGALRDPVDGGFYRRCIDEAWQEPYHQKTLADQARIALALFDAADAAKDDQLRSAAREALRCVTRDMTTAGGAFALALDGTRKEMPDPAKRPAFLQVGTAATGDLGLLLAALARSGDPDLLRTAKTIAASLRASLDQGDLPHVSGQTGSALATAADFTAVALGFQALKDDATAGRLLARANALYFDPGTGAYQAVPAQLPAGIVARVPANGDTPSAEGLALLAGVDAKTADLIRRNLMHAIEYDELPAGDILLGLSLGQK